ncbi:MAG: hypothetical protein AAGC55_14380, partial [Myxococcota bacterium]
RAERADPSEGRLARITALAQRLHLTGQLTITDPHDRPGPVVDDSNSGAEARPVLVEPREQPVGGFGTGNAPDNGER